MAKRKRYDDKFRASAVVMLEAAGYPHKKGALEQTAAHVGVPERTLSRWFNGEQNPPPDQLVSENEIDFIRVIRSELKNVFTAMHAVREEASYKDLTTAAGILLDKLQLLEGKATERTEIIDARITDEERANRIAQLLDTARTRRTGQSANTDILQ